MFNRDNAVLLFSCLLLANTILLPWMEQLKYLDCSPMFTTSKNSPLPGAASQQKHGIDGKLCTRIHFPNHDTDASVHIAGSQGSNLRGQVEELGKDLLSWSGECSFCAVSCSSMVIWKNTHSPLWSRPGELVASFKICTLFYPQANRLPFCIQQCR